MRSVRLKRADARGVVHDGTSLPCNSSNAQSLYPYICHEHSALRAQAETDVMTSKSSAWEFGGHAIAFAEFVLHQPAFPVRFDVNCLTYSSYDSYRLAQWEQWDYAIHPKLVGIAPEAGTPTWEFRMGKCWTDVYVMGSLPKWVILIQIPVIPRFQLKLQFSKVKDWAMSRKIMAKGHLRRWKCFTGRFVSIYFSTAIVLIWTCPFIYN